LGPFWKHFRTIWEVLSGFGAIPPKIFEKGVKKVPLGAHLGTKMGQVGAKMALSCPTWRQDGPKMAILEPKLTNLRPFWEASCPLFGILEAKSQIAKNLQKPQVFNGFSRFLGDLGALGEQFCPILALCWSMLGHFGAILRQLGGKMGPKSAKMSQHSAQDRQHEPT
jgi:hypothetical protein